MNKREVGARFLLSTLLLGGALTSHVAQAQEIPAPINKPYLAPIEIQVNATNLRQKIFDIHEHIPVKAGALTLLYPQWLPGEHGPNGPLVQLASLHMSANHKPIEWQRDEVNMFAFHLNVPANTDSIDLDFQFLSPAQANLGAIVVTPEMLAVHWEKMLLYPAGYYSSAITFKPTLTIPKDWKFASALEVASATDNTIQFKPINMVDFVDSPLYAGKYLNRYDLDPGAKVAVHFDVFSDAPENGIAKPEQIEMHRSLLQQAYKLFGSHHFDHYDFLVAASDNFGFDGLEHHQSGENLVKPSYFQEWDKNLPLRGYLIPHEFTHSWDGKFRRPAGQLTPNYNLPMKNSLLWVYEGQTEYWGFILAARSGLLTQEQVRDSIAMVAADLDANTSRTWRPLQDTTNDPIINNRRPLGWRHWQRAEDYYDEGQLIWLDVDTKIRELSGEKRSLNDFAKAFFGVKDGSHVALPYDFNEVASTLNAIQAYDWDKFLHERLNSHGPGAPLDGLARSGWKLTFTDTPTAYYKANEAENNVADFWYSLGFHIHDGKIGEIAWNSPAFKLGLSANTTVLAVNGHQYKDELLKKAISEAKTSKAPIELLIKTDDVYETVKFDYHEGLKYPRLERIEGTPDRLTSILTAL